MEGSAPWGWPTAEWKKKTTKRRLGRGGGGRIPGTTRYRFLAVTTTDGQAMDRLYSGPLVPPIARRFTPLARSAVGRIARKFVLV
jgi:hypothetical protein